MSAPITLPREMVRASAGTGKTFRISSRIIGLLEAGAAPDTIFASTFTRKAAGEILDRVLARLAAAALDEEAASGLARAVSLSPEHQVDRTREGWLRLLSAFVRQLHRVNIGTLDSFFVRTVGSFPDEVGLPAGWTIADRATIDRLQAEALDEVLRQADPGAIIELVRGITRHDAARSVHEAVLRKAGDLLELHHSIDPTADSPWGSFDGYPGPPAAELAAAQQEIADALRRLPPPENRDGTPKQDWVKALARCAALIEAGEWEQLIEQKLCDEARKEGGTFSRVQITSDVCEIFGAASELARSALARRLARQSHALGRLAALLAGAVERRQRARGAYDFSDLTRLIGGGVPVTARQDLFYRLDQRVQHILLDEFQDTSLTQWEALEPIIHELLCGHRGERAAVIVADPKQSIYAWRGGEPLLVDHVEERFELHEDWLSQSYRSSQVVLDAVNDIFRDLPENPVFAADEDCRSVAREWAADFTEHTAARKHLPGHVTLRVGPTDEGRGTARPNLCRRAAQLVRELWESSPGASIGVLTRKNRTVARIMYELRLIGVPASEEGGNPLTDSPAVASVLALLRMAEHPGDSIARYHVAMTPVGEAEGLRDYRDTRRARDISHTIREKLLTSGYGQTLRDLEARLADSCSPRERRRLTQLVELAFRYDARATLRITDFLAMVEQERVEDPTTADVRVMTVHQAKGLEFDVVVLPELDEPLGGRSPGLLAFRPHPAGRVTRAFPYVNKSVRGLFAEMSELHEAARSASAGALRDGLSGLYVALTRARYALHILVKPDGASASKAMTGARLVRLALGNAAPAVEGAMLHERGDPHWFEKVAEERGKKVPAPRRDPDSSTAEPAIIHLRRDPVRARSFARSSPSELAGGTKIDLRLAMNLDQSAAAEGTIVHVWMERIGWIEEGIPEEEELLSLARAVTPGISEGRLREMTERLRVWLASPVTRAALSRKTFGEAATLEREAPFIHREEGVLVEGFIDRLVLIRKDGEVTGAVVLDYKTDAMVGAEPARLDAKAEHYRPQMEAYRRAVAAGWRIPAERVACRLLFLDAGELREV